MLNRESPPAVYIFENDLKATRLVDNSNSNAKVVNC